MVEISRGIKRGVGLRYPGISKFDRRLAGRHGEPNMPIISHGHKHHRDKTREFIRQGRQIKQRYREFLLSGRHDEIRDFYKRIPGYTAQPVNTLEDRWEAKLAHRISGQFNRVRKRIRRHITSPRLRYAEHKLPKLENLITRLLNPTGRKLSFNIYQALLGLQFEFEMIKKEISAVSSAADKMARNRSKRIMNIISKRMLIRKLHNPHKKHTAKELRDIKMHYIRRLTHKELSNGGKKDRFDLSQSSINRLRHIEKALRNIARGNWDY